jgi:hypothetical protein
MVIMLGREKDGRTTAIMPTAVASACATTESSQYFFRFPPVLASCPTTTPAIVNVTAPNASPNVPPHCHPQSPAMANRRHLPCRSLPRLNFNS